MPRKTLELHEQCKEILSRLIEIVKNCQTKYGGKKELASESDDLVVELCEIWEEVVCFGLKNPNKTTNSVFNEFADVFKMNASNEYSFWDFCHTHLTQHERKRFEQLNHVWTNRGRTKSLLRNALNEHSLQRSLSMWLSDPNLENIYESWSLMIDSESVHLLPSIAGGLNAILFAISIDTPDINSLSRFRVQREEPIILAPTPVGPSNKIMPIKRNIITIDDDKQQYQYKPVLNIPEKLNGLSTSPSSFNNQTQSESPPEFMLNNDDDARENVNYDKENVDDDNLHDNAVSEIDKYLNSLSVFATTQKDNATNPDYIENAADFIESESISNISKSTSSSIINHSHNCLAVESDSAASSTSYIKNIEEELRIMTERCVFLEARVAELKNRRLQRLGNILNNDFGNYMITIPKTNLVHSQRSSYYEYEIHITSREQESWIVCRRYSEFNKLRQDMLKKHSDLVKAIDFPPKKKIGNMNSCFVEERRLRLQIYLKHLLEVLPEISLCTAKEELQGVLSFFK